MGKIKTHKATAKRFSVTGTGKVKMNHNQHRHNLGIKTAKRKRHLRTGAYVSSAKVAANIKSMING
jgi:large subunit ribosomal protein L35